MENHYQNYQFIEVYQQISEDQAAQLAQFWISNGAIPNLVEARRRTSEAVLLVQNEHDELVGVCTVYRSRHTDGNIYYIGRMFIRPDDRVPGLWRAVIKTARDYLETLDIPDKPVGILMATENPKFMRAGAQRMLENIGFRNTGKNRLGQDVMISRFNE